MQFIKSYKLFDDEYCDEIIKTFKKNKELGCVSRRDDGIRRDNQLELNTAVNDHGPNSEMDMRNDGIAVKFFEGLKEGVNQYVSDLGLKNIFNNVWFKNMLVQHYDSDKYESYHTWHCEASTRDSCDRAFVYMLYLNDGFEGGETEFMHQKHREVPLKGNLILWPAGYTHIHRGAMLMSGEKYLVTGWVFY